MIFSGRISPSGKISGGGAVRDFNDFPYYIMSSRTNELKRLRLDIIYAYNIIDTSGAGTRYGIIVIELNRARYRAR